MQYRCLKLILTCNQTKFYDLVEIGRWCEMSRRCEDSSTRASKKQEVCDWSLDLNGTADAKPSGAGNSVMRFQWPAPSCNQQHSCKYPNFMASVMDGFRVGAFLQSRMGSDEQQLRDRSAPMCNRSP